jgi:hypothetical protein
MPIKIQAKDYIFFLMLVIRHGFVESVGESKIE